VRAFITASLAIAALLGACVPLSPRSGSKPAPTTGGTTLGTTGSTTTNGCLSGSICPPGAWTLTFDDEFNGSSIDTSKWIVDPDYSIDSSQYCDKDSTNLWESNGLAHFETFNVSGTPCPVGNYTGGANLHSVQAFGPGYFESRLKGDPNGGGPAGGSGYWLIGGNSSCGGDFTNGFEADVIEYWYSTGHNAAHWDGYGSCHKKLSQGGGLTASDDFHIWGLLYDETNGITFYRDGVQTFHANEGCSSSTPCTTPIIIKYNDNMEGCCTTGEMQVDWFRYYVAQ
jgi:beta-glucanase (GH16 family)